MGYLTSEQYCQVSDELELLKHEATKIKSLLQRELAEEWDIDVRT